jgi:hypothetical membrane protein
VPIEKHLLPRHWLAAPLEGQRGNAIRQALLAAGPLSSLLYVAATDGVAAAKWEGYRRTEQMVSELLAVGSPGRDAIVPLLWIYTLLFIAFGVGVWSSTHGNRALRTGGGLLIGYGLGNIVGGVFPLRLGDETSVPLHILATNVQLALMVAAMCFVAAGFHGRMRWYSIISLVLSAVMGMIAFMAAPGPNLVLGIGERISIGAFLLWVAVLAVALWKRTLSRQAAEGPPS